MLVDGYKDRIAQAGICVNIKRMNMDIKGQKREQIGKWMGLCRKILQILALIAELHSSLCFGTVILLTTMLK